MASLEIGVRVHVLHCPGVGGLCICVWGRPKALKNFYMARDGRST